MPFLGMNFQGVLDTSFAKAGPALVENCLLFNFTQQRLIEARLIPALVCMLVCSRIRQFLSKVSRRLYPCLGRELDA
jgi:hypothetical protein